HFRPLGQGRRGRGTTRGQRDTDASFDAADGARLGGWGAEEKKNEGFVPHVPSTVMRATDAPTPGDSHRAMLEERLRDPEFRIEYERSTVTCSSSSRRRRRDQS